MHAQDRLAALEVRSLDGDLPVEAARAQQRGVEDVGPVGRGDEDDVRLDVEAVHLDEELVERLLALVVAPAHAGAAVPPDGVDLVDEDDRGRVLLGLVEQVAHAARADTHEHLDEVRAGDRVERHARLAGDGAREQGLAGPGGPVEQDALGDLRAHGLELGRVREELLDLLELLDRLVLARHVSERDLRHVLGDELRAGLAEAHHAVPATLHAGQQEPEDQADDQEGDHEREQRRPERGLRDLRVVALRRVRLHDGVHDLGALRLHVVELHGLAVVLAVGLEVGLQVELDALVAVDDQRRLDLVLVQQLDALVRVDPLDLRPGQDAERRPEHDQGHDHPDDRAAEDSLHVHRCRGCAPVPPLALVCSETTRSR